MRAASETACWRRWLSRAGPRSAGRAETGRPGALRLDRKWRALSSGAAGPSLTSLSPAGTPRLVCHRRFKIASLYMLSQGSWRARDLPPPTQLGAALIPRPSERVEQRAGTLYLIEKGKS